MNCAVVKQNILCSELPMKKRSIEGLICNHLKAMAWLSLHLKLVKLTFFCHLVSNCLQLGKHKEALDFAVAAQYLSPSDTMAAEKVENIKKHLAAGLCLVHVHYHPY